VCAGSRCFQSISLFLVPCSLGARWARPLSPPLFVGFRAFFFAAGLVTVSRDVDLSFL